MNNSMRPLNQVLDDRHDWIKGYKEESGKKVAGCFCDYVPEEIELRYLLINKTGGNTMNLIELADQNIERFGEVPKLVFEDKELTTRR